MHIKSVRDYVNPTVSMVGLKIYKMTRKLSLEICLL